MSRGQQGIGISAAGMYGQLTTGKPVRITSRTSARSPAHYFEVQIDTNFDAAIRSPVPGCVAKKPPPLAPSISVSR